MTGSVFQMSEDEKMLFKLEWDMARFNVLKKIKGRKAKVKDMPITCVDPKYHYAKDDRIRNYCVEWKRTENSSPCVKKYMTMKAAREFFNEMDPKNIVYKKFFVIYN